MKSGEDEPQMTQICADLANSRERAQRAHRGDVNGVGVFQPPIFR